MQDEELLATVKATLGDVLRLGGRERQWSAETLLLGSVPEFDSMAVVAVIAALEESFDVQFSDDDIRAEAFRSVGTLTALVREKCAE